jgi:hypothetical protein
MAFESILGKWTQSVLCNEIIPESEPKGLAKGAARVEGLEVRHKSGRQALPVGVLVPCQFMFDYDGTQKMGRHCESE